MTTDHRALAEACRKSAAESWERSDTDGFLSQWASGIQARVHDLQADLDEKGGVDTFPALFYRATGTRAPARLTRAYSKFTHSHYSVWQVFEPTGRHVIHWIPAFKEGKNSKMYKLGYFEGEEEAPAVAFIDGVGTGLSGQAWASVRRTDGGWPGRNKNV